MPNKSDYVNRRHFVASAISAMGLASLPDLWMAGHQEELTVQRVIDLILSSIPAGKLSQTVDTLKSGAPDQRVTGIVTTMFATIDVIKKAISLGANFIIAHEPTFYNHLDETNWLENDTVFNSKRKLLTDNNIAIWRFHDHWHRHEPDGVRMGVLTALGWEEYYDRDNPAVITIPRTSLKDIVDHMKSKLAISQLRFIGDLSQTCRRVGLMPGASGGRSHISLLAQENLDVLICGEVAEWETAERVRDARSMGWNQSLVVLGHSQSEEPGMEWLVPWLKQRVGKIPIHHVPSGNPFSFV